MKEQYLTKEGLTEIRDRLHTLKTVRRREIADAIHTAKEQGDLSENAEYASAKEEQTKLEQEIAAIEDTLKHAQVIAKGTDGEVGIGNTVTLKWGRAEKVFRIVGSNEANPLEGKISNESPIGQALIGRKKGEAVSIPTPSGEKECIVKAIA
ncbi:MAG: transcription elongation factor GreA [Candidatus Andersenbacteria bacterium]|nr:transcription elongation factor GreA [Candidatus Andersenbacteria bacterium]MBI3250344.1 transcription elongation factor GreA [Candidatus Andersenbacteria bacterium]